MRIALYDPYLDTLGGGERYICTLAEYLSQNHEVDIFWDDKTIKEKLQKTLNLDLNRVNISTNIFNHKFSAIKRALILSKYDRLFYLSDGSFHIVTAKKNYLHFQFPISWDNTHNLKNKIKIKLFSKIICNSFYTKKFIDHNYGVNSVVIYPPVDIDKFQPLIKEKIILSVGRFTTSLHHKRQDVLLTVFKKLVDQGFKDWKLILAGGLAFDGTELINQLKKEAIGYTVELKVNINFKELIKLYGISSIYWHGAGFGVDTDKNPQNTEHFGISIVEAMSAGSVPFVVDNGGQTEIVENGFNGFTYLSIEELVTKTLNLICNPAQQQSLKEKAIAKSKRFSKERFCAEIGKIMEVK